MYTYVNVDDFDDEEEEEEAAAAEDRVDEARKELVSSVHENSNTSRICIGAWGFEK